MRYSRRLSHRSSQRPCNQTTDCLHFMCELLALYAAAFCRLKTSFPGHSRLKTAIVLQLPKRKKTAKSVPSAVATAPKGMATSHPTPNAVDAVLRMPRSRKKSVPRRQRLLCTPPKTDLPQRPNLYRSPNSPSATSLLFVQVTKRLLFAGGFYIDLPITP